MSPEKKVDAVDAAAAWPVPERVGIGPRMLVSPYWATELYMTMSLAVNAPEKQWMRVSIS